MTAALVGTPTTAAAAGSRAVVTAAGSTAATRARSQTTAPPVTHRVGHATNGLRAVHAGHAAVAPAVSAGHLLVQLLLGLAVVVALVVGASRLLRGRSGIGRAFGRRTPLRVVAKHSFGKGVSVAVVELGDRAYLVGVTPSSIRRLAETDAAELAGGDLPADGADGAVAPSSLGGGGLRTAFGTAQARLRELAGARPSGPGRAAGSRVPVVRAPSSRLRRSPTVVEVVALPADAVGRSSPRRRPAAGTAPVDHRPVDHGPVTRAHRRSSLSVARPAVPRGPRPAPTWTSAIEQLRERTVRRA